MQYQEDLNELVETSCDKKDCSHEEHHVLIASKCHPTAMTKAVYSYKDKTLSIYCGGSVFAPDGSQSPCGAPVIKLLSACGRPARHLHMVPGTGQKHSQSARENRSKKKK